MVYQRLKWIYQKLNTKKYLEKEKKVLNQSKLFKQFYSAQNINIFMQKFLNPSIADDVNCHHHPVLIEHDLHKLFTVPN